MPFWPRCKVSSRCQQRGSRRELIFRRESHLSGVSNNKALFLEMSQGGKPNHHEWQRQPQEEEEKDKLETQRPRQRGTWLSQRSPSQGGENSPSLSLFAAGGTAPCQLRCSASPCSAPNVQTCPGRGGRVTKTSIWELRVAGVQTLPLEELRLCSSKANIWWELRHVY